MGIRSDRGVVGDAVSFARERLGFDPDETQERVLAGGRRGIVNCTRQGGTSTVIAALATWRAYSEAGALVLALSPSARQSGEFLRKVEGFVRRLGIRVRGDGDNEISVALPNGSRIIGLPGCERTVRGFSAVSLMVVDEAARTPDELYRAMRPALAARDGDLWLMSTPNGRRGFFWEEWSGGGDGWVRICVPATECSRISASFLEEERARGEEFFRQEYLCEFLDHEGAVFPGELIEGAFGGESFSGLEL